jgi:hypothetical protein
MSFGQHSDSDRSDHGIGGQLLYLCRVDGFDAAKAVRPVIVGGCGKKRGMADVLPDSMAAIAASGLPGGCRYHESLGVLNTSLTGQEPSDKNAIMVVP